MWTARSADLSCGHRERTAGHRDLRPAARRPSGGMPGGGGAGTPALTAVRRRWTQAQSTVITFGWWPFRRSSRLVREAAARHVPALVAQEPLDVGDEVVARRQPLLVVHRLEPLDVGAGRLVERWPPCRDASAARGPPRSARRPRSRSRSACRAPGAARAPPSRTDPRRNAGPGRSSRAPGCPAAATSISSADTSADGTRSVPAGPAETVPRSRPGVASVPMIGTARVCGTAAGIAPRLIHSTTPSRRVSSITSVVSARQR